MEFIIKVDTKNKKKMDAMVIGADRSGSTWLRKLCIQNPDIYVCPVWQKEFLSKQAVNRDKFYRPMKFNCPLDDYNGEKVILGVRNMALYHRNKVAKMYYSNNKNMKFLLSLRNPIDRTFSQFMVRNLLRENNNNNPHYDINKEISIDQAHVQRTMVFTLLKPYINYFSTENFFIYPMELMKSDTVELLNKLYSFLGVRQNIPINLKETNKLANAGKYDRDKFVPMTESSKKTLVKICKSEIESLSQLCEIDLLKFWGLKKYI